MTGRTQASGPTRLKDVATGQMYSLDIETITACLQASSFTRDTPEDEYDPRAIPVSITELRDMAEAVFCHGAPAELLWEMRERRRYENLN